MTAITIPLPGLGLEKTPEGYKVRLPDQQPQAGESQQHGARVKSMLSGCANQTYHLDGCTFIYQGRSVPGERLAELLGLKEKVDGAQQITPGG